VKITVHPGGSLLPHPQILPAVRNGQIQMGEVLMSLLANENPLFNLDSIPFVAMSYEGAQRLYQAQRPEVERWLAQRGVVFLYAVPWPPQGLYTKKPVQSAQDLQGIRFRAYNPATARLAELLGMTPVQVEAADIPQAFATGIVEAMITSPVTGVDSQAWDFARYFYDVKAWIPKNMGVIGRRAFESLSPQDREALLQAAKRAEKRGWRLSQEQEEKALKTLESRGMQVVKPSPQLLADLKKVGGTMIVEWQRQAGATGVKVYRQYLGRMSLLFRLAELLAALMGLFVLLVILAQVVERFLGFVVPSALELAGYATAGLIFLGLAPTLRAGGHIRVGLLLERLPPGPRRAVEAGALLLGLLASLFAAYHAWAKAAESYRYGDLAPGLLPLPLWLPQGFLALGLSFFALGLLEAFLKAARRER